MAGDRCDKRHSHKLDNISKLYGYALHRLCCVFLRFFHVFYVLVLFFLFGSIHFVLLCCPVIFTLFRFNLS